MSKPTNLNPNSNYAAYALALAAGIGAAHSAKKRFSKTEEQNPAFVEQQEDAPLKQDIFNEKNVDFIKEETLIIDNDKQNTKPSNKATKVNDEEPPAPEKSWVETVSNFIGAIPHFFLKTLPSRVRRASSWLWSAFKSIPGKISYVWNFATSSEGKTVPLKTQEQIDQEAKEKHEQLLRDLGISQDGYDRDFLSSKGKKFPDLDDDTNSANPMSSAKFVLLNLHEQGECNCKSTFQKWEETNAKIDIKSQERHKLADKNAELEMESQKIRNWVQIGVIAVGIVGCVLGGWAVAAGLATVAGVCKLVTSKFPGEAVAGVITAKADLAVKQNQNLINSMDLEMKLLENHASMISQDMSRLYQTNSTIISILQTIIRAMQESRQAIAGSIK